MIKRESNINFTMWPELHSAINTLIENGEYQEIVNIHASMNAGTATHRMHGNSGEVGYQRFLPWHRAYLLLFEESLRKENPDLSIPYWDWNADKENLTGFNDLTGLAIRRDRQSNRIEWFTSQEQVNDLLAIEDYSTFTKTLENDPHNDGHRWIGGDMETMRSPNDPAFWFHHAQIDRIWALWQKKGSNNNKKAALSEADATLDPWGWNINNVNDISDLGDASYEYV